MIGRCKPHPTLRKVSNLLQQSYISLWCHINTMRKLVNVSLCVKRQGHCCDVSCAELFACRAGRRRHPGRLSLPSLKPVWSQTTTNRRFDLSNDALRDAALQRDDIYTSVMSQNITSHFVKGDTRNPGTLKKLHWKICYFQHIHI